MLQHRCSAPPPARGARRAVDSTLPPIPLIQVFLVFLVFLARHSPIGSLTGLAGLPEIAASDADVDGRADRRRREAAFGVASMFLFCWRSGSGGGQAIMDIIAGSPA